jgi:D-alanyl-lipoteichoic acid acyltransferase DltB (MBOAT superfamily)
VLTFFTFVAFFPQLVAGPIERAGNLIPQFETKRSFSFSQGSSGLKLILWGLLKKMVIADQLAVIVNEVYLSPENFNGWGIILSTFLFGFQIYCDFSGYSDIAIGTARLFGIELMTNFRTPYFSNSFREFWHRWHISLSTWFRDYLYIPLGGNRSGLQKWIRNIIITFTISGLWHGASFTFLIWGFIHGIFLVAEHFISPVINIKSKLKNFAGFVVTFTFTNLAWLFFRAENWNHFTILFENIISPKTVSFNSFLNLLFDSSHLTGPARMLAFVFPVFIFTEILLGKNEFSNFLRNSPKYYRWVFYYVIILAILFFGVLNSAPQFIYFQF